MKRLPSKNLYLPITTLSLCVSEYYSQHAFSNKWYRYFGIKYSSINIVRKAIKKASRKQR